MKIAVMQPYFFPYIGYFQLIESVDTFVVYDNVKYTKKGWVNRNRLLRNGVDVVFTVPIRKDSDSLDIRDRTLAGDFDRSKLVRQIREAYRHAPEFDGSMPVIERSVMSGRDNLFEYILESVVGVCGYLGISTRIVPSSTLDVDGSLTGQDRVLAICEAVGASTYINAIGGQELYRHDAFGARGISLRFLRSSPIDYPQFGGQFVPWLSIIDVMMFNPVSEIRGFLEAGWEFA
jgi:hypothetical protein